MSSFPSKTAHLTTESAPIDRRYWPRPFPPPIPVHAENSLAWLSVSVPASANELVNPVVFWPAWKGFDHFRHQFAG